MLYQMMQGLEQTFSIKESERILKGEKMSIKFLLWNLWEEGLWVERLVEIVSEMEKAGFGGKNYEPQVVLFLEAIVAQSYNSLSDINGSLGSVFVTSVFFPNRYDYGMWRGNGILSNMLPVRSWVPERRRPSGFVQLRYDKSDFIAASLHTDAFDAEKRMQDIENLLEDLQTVNNGNLPVVLGTDLNAEPSSVEVEMLVNAGFADSWKLLNKPETVTWPANREMFVQMYERRSGTRPKFFDSETGKSKRIDYFFIKDATVSEIGVIGTSGKASDHAGIVADIDF